TPSQDAQSFFANDALENAFAVQPRMFLNRQKSHPDGILTGRGQLESEGGALAGEKLMRDLNQNTGAITGLRIATACSPVGEIYQDLNALLNYFVALLTPNAGDEPHSAGVVFVRGIVKTLARRQTVLCFPKLQRDFPKGVAELHTPIAVYIFGTAIRGQKYNSEFRFGRWKFCKICQKVVATEK